MVAWRQRRQSGSAICCWQYHNPAASSFQTSACWLRQSDYHAVWTM